jgi:hypothetical protein
MRARRYTRCKFGAPRGIASNHANFRHVSFMECKMQAYRNIYFNLRRNSDSFWPLTLLRPKKFMTLSATNAARNEYFSRSYSRVHNPITVAQFCLACKLRYILTRNVQDDTYYCLEFFCFYLWILFYNKIFVLKYFFLEEIFEINLNLIFASQYIKLYSVLLILYAYLSME